MHFVGFPASCRARRRSSNPFLCVFCSSRNQIITPRCSLQTQACPQRTLRGPVSLNEHLSSAVRRPLFWNPPEPTGPLYSPTGTSRFRPRNRTGQLEVNGEEAFAICVSLSELFPRCEIWVDLCRNDFEPGFSGLQRVPVSRCASEDSLAGDRKPCRVVHRSMDSSF